MADEVVPAQIANGAVTIPNMCFDLAERYRFLRREAEAAFERPPPPPEKGTSGGWQWTRQDIGRPRREAGALATASVDAYFSMLEHLFVIAAAFVPGALTKEGLRGILNATWSERARAVLDLGDPSTKSAYDRLFDIREDWRKRRHDVHANMDY